MRCEEGEYEAPATPDRFVRRQNVVGRTVMMLACPSLDELAHALTEWGRWTRELAPVRRRRRREKTPRYDVCYGRGVG